MHNSISLGQYLLSRLKELGISHIFGVPGDYNLVFLDEVVNDQDLTWVGNCNELNAAYAADGYARIKGAGALVTTFGVGELSAMNGLAGSYAEHVPVVSIVCAPSSTMQQSGALMHHTFANGQFDMFAKMFTEITSAQALLTKENPTEHIDRVLRECWIKKRPVYILLPSDLIQMPVQKPSKKLDLSYPESDMNAVEELSDKIAALLNQAQRPIILIDICAFRHPMREFILQLLDKTKIDFATLNMSKGLIDESHPQFIGIYNGVYSSPGVQQKVEQSDCILSFDIIMCDFNSGGFTSKVDPNVSIEIHSDTVKIHQALYEHVYFNAVIPALINKVHAHHANSNTVSSPLLAKETSATVISQNRFWQLMENFLQTGDIVVTDMGTTIFGLLPRHLPNATTMISQPLWSSIGFSVPAGLGALIAAPTRRIIMFVGDGAFQCTAQEVSTMMYLKLNPIIFLINNDGYSIERAIHGPKMSYNDINMWDYAKLPHIFGENAWTKRVISETELEQALQELSEYPKQLKLIEVITDRFDYPGALKQIGQDAEKFNASKT